MASRGKRPQGNSRAAAGLALACACWLAAAIAAGQDITLSPEYLADGVGYPVRYSLTQQFNNRFHRFDDTNAVTRLGMFLPLWETDDSLLFGDLQPFFDNGGNLGSNLGLGFRFYSPDFDRVFGIYSYFDYRETGQVPLKQGTLGFDSLGRWVDLRANLYFADQIKQPVDAAFVPPRFEGNSLLLGFQQAIPGTDGEVGVVLPPIADTQTRLLGGGYFYDMPDGEDAIGGRVRAETHWTSWCSTDIAYNRDDVFGSTLTISVTFNGQPETYHREMPAMASFRRGEDRHITRSGADRLAEPVQREWLIPYRTGDDLPAVNPQTDQPYRFLQVVSGAVDGNGTIETPFGTLDAALAAASSGDIVYTPQGGSFSSIAPLIIPDGVQLLSNGPQQILPIPDGSVMLPGSGNVEIDFAALLTAMNVGDLQSAGFANLANLPQIHADVSLSDGSKLDGFALGNFQNVMTPATTGTVSADEKKDFTISRNAIRASGDGIQVNGGENVTISSNLIAGNLESGLQIAGRGFSGTITQNIFALNQQGGMRATVAENFSATISTNRFASNTDSTGRGEGHGIFLEAGRILPGTTISQNLIDSNADEGIVLSLIGTGGGMGMAASNVTVTTNVSRMNNGGNQREFFAELATDAGPWTVNLNGNTSANRVPMGQFNFDFSQPIDEDALDVSITTPNIGSVGSSNGSVEITQPTTPAPMTSP